jgi:hypothetical protein
VQVSPGLGSPNKVIFVLQQMQEYVQAVEMALFRQNSVCISHIFATVVIRGPYLSISSPDS